MANVAGGGGGRTGPYWRRQLGITEPGERTLDQLNIINLLRQRAGLPPQGGQRRAILPGEGVRSMLPPGAIQRPQHRAMPAQHVPSPLVRHPADIEPMPGEGLGGTTIDPRDITERFPGPGVKTFGQGMDELGGGGGHSDLRNRLLQSVPGAEDEQQGPLRGGVRAALQHYLQQQSLRHAQPGRGRRPILPGRPPLRRAQPARHPY